MTLDLERGRHKRNKGRIIIPTTSYSIHVHIQYNTENSALIWMKIEICASSKSGLFCENTSHIISLKLDSVFVFYFRIWYSFPTQFVIISANHMTDLYDSIGILTWNAKNL